MKVFSEKTCKITFSRLYLIKLYVSQTIILTHFNMIPYLAFIYQPSSYRGTSEKDIPCATNHIHMQPKLTTFAHQHSTFPYYPSPYLQQHTQKQPYTLSNFFVLYQIPTRLSRKISQESNDISKLFMLRTNLNISFKLLQC